MEDRCSQVTASSAMNVDVLKRHDRHVDRHGSNDISRRVRAHAHACDHVRIWLRRSDLARRGHGKLDLPGRGVHVRNGPVLEGLAGLNLNGYCRRPACDVSNV